MFIVKPLLYPVDQELIDKDTYYQVKIDNEQPQNGQCRVLKEILEFILEKRLQPDQKNPVQKAYRRVLLFEKKDSWLKVSNFQNSSLNAFQFHTNIYSHDEIKNNQAILKLTQIVQHFIPEFIEFKRKQLTIENEFMEYSLSEILKEIIQDYFNYKIYKSDVQHCLLAIQFYQAKQDEETNKIINSLNSYIKQVLFQKADLQQMSIENQELMLKAFQQTFNKWYEKSKARFTEKLNNLKIQASQAEIEIKKYQLELQELEAYEKRLNEDKDLADLVQQNKELWNQINKSN